MEIVVFLLLLAMAHGQLYDRLYKQLMRGDVAGTIPQIKLNEPVSVELSVSLIRVNSIDPETGDAELELWIGYYWSDTRLRWSSRRYNNITNIRVQPDRIWRPDIELYDGEMTARNCLAVLYQNGELLYMPKTRVKLRCDVSNYTSDDTVTCSMKFGSWTYNGLELDIHIKGSHNTGVDVYDFIEDRWTLESNLFERDVKRYTCCPEPYPDLRVTLVFRDNKSSSWSLF